MTEERQTYNDDLDVVEGRENLWRAVLMQTIAEASGTGLVGTTPSSRARVISEARDYLTIPNEGFNTVCSLAGLDPDAVREGIARQLAKAPTPEALKQEAQWPRQRNRQYTLNGETLTIREWSRRTGLGTQTLHKRLASGWTVERALTTPAALRAIRGPQ